MRDEQKTKSTSCDVANEAAGEDRGGEVHDGRGRGRGDAKEGAWETDEGKEWAVEEKRGKGRKGVEE